MNGINGKLNIVRENISEFENITIEIIKIKTEKKKMEYQWAVGQSQES